MSKEDCYNLALAIRDLEDILEPKGIPDSTVLVFWDECSAFTLEQYHKLLQRGASKAMDATLYHQLVVPTKNADMVVYALDEQSCEEYNEPTPKEIYNAVRKPIAPWDRRYKQKGKVKR